MLCPGGAKTNRRSGAVQGSSAHLVILLFERVNRLHWAALEDSGHRMQASTLLPDVAEIALESIRSDRSTIRLLVHVARPEASCPLCSHSSMRIHSRYERRLADLPWNGIPVQVILRTRRFFCGTAGCSQRGLYRAAASYGRSLCPQDKAIEPGNGVVHASAGRRSRGTARPTPWRADKQRYIDPAVAPSEFGYFSHAANTWH